MDPARQKIYTWLLIVLSAALMIDATPANAAEFKKRGLNPRTNAPRLLLPEAVATAITRNLRMTDARLAIREEEAKRREAYSDFFPTIDVQYGAQGYKYQQSSNIAAFGAAHDSRWYLRYNGSAILGSPVPTFNPEYPYRIDPYRAFSLSATLTQPLFTGAKLLNNYKYARLGVDYSQIQMAVDRQDLILDVYEAYEQLVQAHKLLKVAQQSIVALTSLRDQTREFFKAGVVPKVDVLSTEGQLAQARIQRTQSLANIQIYRSVLNLLLRFPPDTPVEVDLSLKYEANSYTIPNIYTVAARNRLEIRQANISVEQAIALVRASQADLMPAVSMQLAGSRTNDDWNPLDQEAINDWSIRGILTWSFDMFRTRETVTERRATQARAFVAREQLVENIMDEVKRAYENMKRSESDIFDNTKAVEFRKENFRINQERYKEQVATYTEVLDAQRELAQAQGDYYISMIQYKINRARLERAMGILR